MLLQNLKKIAKVSLLTIIIVLTTSIGLYHIRVPLQKAEHFSYKPFESYKKLFAKMESENELTRVNGIGMMGLYQFKLSTLKELGVHKLMPKNVVTDEQIREYFLHNRKIQDKAFELYIKYNKKHLKKYIKKYDKTYYKGVYITESGILAAAHAKGTTGLKNFFDYGNNKKDANGCTAWSRMKKFSLYEIDID